MRKNILCFCAFLCLVFNLNEINAQTLNVQGMLRDADNRAVPNGEYDVRLELYDSEEGGTNLFWEDHSANIVNGVYSIDLGSVRETEFRELDFSNTYWLSVKIEGKRITERTRLSMSPYLFKPINATNMIPNKGLSIFGDDIKTPLQWSVLNGDNNPIFKTGQSNSWGNYTSVLGGWGSSKNRPFGLVMSEAGLVYSNKLSDLDNYGNPLFRIDNNGRMKIGYGDKTMDEDPRAFIDVKTNGKNRGIKAGAYIELNQTQANEPFYSINAHYEDGDLYNGSFRFKPVHAPGTGMILMSNAGQGHFRWFGVNWAGNGNPRGLNEFKEAMIIKVDGKVGIGTHSPEASLDVRGDVAMLGDLVLYDFDSKNFTSDIFNGGITATTDGFVIVTAMIRAGSYDDEVTLIPQYKKAGTSDFSEITQWSPTPTRSHSVVDTFIFPVQKEMVWRIEVHAKNNLTHLEIKFMPMGR